MLLTILKVIVILLLRKKKEEERRRKELEEHIRTENDTDCDSDSDSDNYSVGGSTRVPVDYKIIKYDRIEKAFKIK